MPNDNEIVLALPREVIPAGILGAGQPMPWPGLQSAMYRYGVELPHGQLTGSTMYVQPIPYVAIVDPGTGCVLVAQRPDKQAADTEARLAGKLYMGHGGHINADDRRDLRRAAARELAEELYLRGEWRHAADALVDQLVKGFPTSDGMMEHIMQAFWRAVTAPAMDAAVVFHRDGSQVDTEHLAVLLTVSASAAALGVVGSPNVAWLPPKWLLGHPQLEAWSELYVKFLCEEAQSA